MVQLVLHCTPKGSRVLRYSQNFRQERAKGLEPSTFSLGSESLSPEKKRENALFPQYVAGCRRLKSIHGFRKC